MDPSKLVVLLSGTGASGYDVEADLLARQMPLEMAGQDTVIPMVTIADDEGVNELTEVLMNVIARRRSSPRKPVVAATWSVEPETVMAPRAATLQVVTE